MTLTNAEQTAQAAKMLDKHEPGWASKIDVSKLRLSGATSCILGQITRDFFGARALELRRLMNSSEDLWCSDQSFRHHWLVEIDKRLQTSDPEPMVPLSELRVLFEDVPSIPLAELIAKYDPEQLVIKVEFTVAELRLLQHTAGRSIAEKAKAALES